MHLYFRKAVILGFIAAALAAAGCSRAASFGNGEYELDRPLVLPETTASRKKIIALGDSLTAGFGLAENESYPYLLQQKLKAEGYEYEVINAGVSGDTSLGGLERADWVLSQPNAEILILELGANDLLRGMPVDKMKSNLAGIIEKAKAKNMKILLCGMLAPPSMGSDYETNYRNAFPDLADEYAVAFLPFLLDGIAMKKELNQADGIHPNAEGTRLMMENIYAALEPLLTK
ncbi:MAG: arylesterase [Acidobacteria bacterium]|nr:arylesterase [Acidobacteriota bacterium]